MAYDDTLIIDHIKATHDTELLSEREKHLVGLAVTLTRGCQVCTRNRIEKARAIGITDDELNALIAVTAAVNSGVTGATARIAHGMLEAEAAEACGDTCSPNPE
ncbi:MAG: carboxymuconolactone decarboxylase family protein [Planctomycetota bacterium]|jgi:AhpD family alkylhydroperoxidase